MAECIICDGKNEKNKLFEDDEIIITLALEPSVNGHMQIFPKKHYTILEQVPEKTLDILVDSANKLSMILFEAMKVHGTNIIINNGVPAGQKIPHFSIDIIPRRNDDSLKLDWELKQASPDSLDTMHRIIAEGISDNIRPAQPEPERSPPPKDIEKQKGLEIDAMAHEGRSAIKPISDEEHESHVHRKHPEEKKTNYHHHLFDRVP